MSILTNFGLTVAFLAVIAIMAVFAFGFDAPIELVMTILVIGFVTAFAEHYLRSRNE